MSEDKDKQQWADPYQFKNMKEALKFSMGFNERLVAVFEQQVVKLEEAEKMINTQAIIIDELTVELEETKTAVNLQREEYESQLMSQRTYRQNEASAAVQPENQQPKTIALAVETTTMTTTT